MERIELDEEIPELVPRSPLPRFKKVTLKELMEALSKAITTENRRIKKEILNKNALREVDISMPKRKISITDKIQEIYSKLLKHLDDKDVRLSIPYSEFVGDNKDERIISFSPLLHLENQQKVWMEQEEHFNEINIWMKHTYVKHKGDPFAELREEIEEELEQLDDEGKKRIEEINQDFENPLGEMLE
jgi:chromatin segregation and condensation protein Rec8/ScpA/Scc1 (kleisin family)